VNLACEASRIDGYLLAAATLKEDGTSFLCVHLGEGRWPSRRLFFLGTSEAVSGGRPFGASAPAVSGGSLGRLPTPRI